MKASRGAGVRMHTAEAMLVVAAYVLGFALLGFLLRRWIALVLPPIVWSLLYFGPEQGWWARTPVKPRGSSSPSRSASSACSR